MISARLKQFLDDNGAVYLHNQARHIESKIDVLERFEPDDFETPESEAEPVPATSL